MDAEGIEDDHPTWIVLVRDLSDLASDGTTFVSLVLDAATGMARGVAIGRTASEARTTAMNSAASEPVAPLTNAPVPREVLCAPGSAAALTKDLAAVIGRGPLPTVREMPLPPASEDILDELLAHLSGRALPNELPTVDDWALLVEQTLAYAQEEPWQDWPNDLQFKVAVTCEGTSASYVAAVIGREGQQAGLVLYAGKDLSAVVIPADDWQPEDPLPFLEGSLLLHLNPPDDTLEDMAAKAVRYGWPESAPRMPVWLTADPEGFGDLSRSGAMFLTLALAGVLARHRRAAGPKGKRTARTTGSLALAGGAEGRYTVTDLS